MSTSDARDAARRRTSGATSGVRAARVILLAIPLASAPLAAAPHVALDGIAQLDAQSAATLELMVDGDLQRAAVLARQLARRFPRFPLGQLLHAELSSLAALDGTWVDGDWPWSPALLELLLEARARLESAAREPLRPGPSPAASAPASPDAPETALLPLPTVTAPAPFLQVGNGVHHLVLVDLERSRLSLHDVRGGQSVHVSDHYVASGSAGFGKRREGDRKTPLGLYRIDGVHEDAALPDLYGSGALVLDYPNALDRALGRTGSGIWLHGVPHASLSRPPHSSEGCVTMSNEHVTALRRRIDPDATLVALSAGTRAHAGSTGRADPDGLPPAERLAHRHSLFRRYRSGHVGEAESRLDAATLAALRTLPVEAVTVFESPAEADSGTTALTIMDIRPDADGATRITLHWARDAAGGWDLLLETVERDTARISLDTPPEDSPPAQG